MASPKDSSGIVLHKDGRFLGWSGNFVSEYPDALLFDTMAEARLSAATVNLEEQAEVAKAVSAEDYAAGNY